MDWNAKWDWENLVMLNSKAVESPKKLQATDWGIEEGGELDVVSFNLSGGGGGGCGASGSDLGLGSSAKSSISSSTDLSSKEGMKTSNFTFETFEGFPGDFNKKKEFTGAKLTGTSPSLEVSVVSGEPLIGLKLGKRTYFENNCAGSNAKTSSSAAIAVSSAIAAKKIKSSGQSASPPCCQVEGCNLELSSAKEYHRKHRVCESHSKCPRVIVGGLERRFCQQCSRFHGLSEFEEKKRSCCRRLSDHNARRRKPQQVAIQFDSARICAPFYGGGQQISFELNNVPVVHSRPAGNPSWESTCRSKFTLTKECSLKPEKAGSIDGQPHAISMLSHDSNGLLSRKGIMAELFNQGLQESMFSSSLDVAPDFRCALSLLSTNSWGSEPEPITLDHSMQVNHASIPQPMMHAVPSLPLASSEYWQTEPQSTDSQMQSLTLNGNNISNHFHEIQLFKSANVTGFYPNPLN